jgi:hypothetical protein
MFGKTRNVQSVKQVFFSVPFFGIFVYRMLLMNWTTFPPGSDVGLHKKRHPLDHFI